MSRRNSLIKPETIRDHRARWYVYGGGYGSPLVKMPHQASMRGHWPGWDVECSCGWESRTGGATKTSVQLDLDTHRLDEQLRIQVATERTCLGSGILNWPRGERVTDRYGTVFLTDDPDQEQRYWTRLPYVPEGVWGTLTAVVVEVRRLRWSDDDLDATEPTAPCAVGDVIKLGTGYAFRSYDGGHLIGLRPALSDGIENRCGTDDHWLDPEALRKVQDQRVSLEFTPERRDPEGRTA